MRCLLFENPNSVCHGVGEREGHHPGQYDCSNAVSSATSAQVAVSLGQAIRLPKRQESYAMCYLHSQPLEV